MVPCKFQTDSTGTRILAYSEDRETVYAQIEEEELYDAVAEHLGFTGPMQKGYAMAGSVADGELAIGPVLEEQDF